MTQNSATFLLVPGYWLGSWAWQAVVTELEAAGHNAVPVTLPGLETADRDRSRIRLGDHIRAVVEVIRAQSGRPLILVAHSGAGAVATGVLDVVPELVDRVIYVDSGPAADGAVASPELPPELIELPLPEWSEFTASGTSLAGLDDEALATFQKRAVPHPAGPLRDPILLADPARNEVPATVVCCSFPAAQVQALADQGVPMFAALTALTHVRYVDLQTGHWPMWSRPADLARLLAEAAAAG